jgi:hypothetical protein
MPNYHIAQTNIGHILAPIDDPIIAMEEFIEE